MAAPLASAFEVASALLSRIGEQVIFLRVGDVVVVTFGVLAGIGTLLAFTWMSLLWVGQGLAAEHLLGIGAGGGARAVHEARSAAIASMISKRLIWLVPS